MSTFRFLCPIILIAFCSLNICSQTTEKKDTVFVNKLLSEAQYYLNRNTDSSYFLADKALKLALKLSSLKHVSIAYQNLGYYYTEKEDFVKAIDYFLKALKIEEKRKDEGRIASLKDDLGYMYQLMEKFERALNFYNDALSHYEKIRDTLSIASSFLHLGHLHSYREYCESRNKAQKTKDYNTAIWYFEKSSALYESLGNKSGVASCNTNLVAVYNKLEKPEIAYQYATKALNYYRSVDNWRGIVGVLSSLGGTHRRLKQYNKSIDCYRECEVISKKCNLTGGIQYLYEAMAQTFDDAKDYKNARDYYVKYMILRDSIYNAAKSKQIFELETKYQTEKKEKDILGLKYEKKKKNQFIFLLGSVILVLSISAVYVIYTIRRKRIIAEQANEIKDQKILQLEKDHQIEAAHAVLEGEEKERVRLSRDLHDGLGGMLTGVKLNLTNIKGKYFLNHSSVNQFDHAIDLLDSSIKELRRVAHSMMPESLVKFGLKDALQDFCDQLSLGNKSSVQFNFFGEQMRVENSLEIAIYRIMQELVNNAMKHAKATEIMVHLIQENHRVYLTVMDNGQGFDVSQIDNLKTAGLHNIQARIASFKGKMNIDSDPEKGTEIGVEFEIDSPETTKGL